jgi:hypothetical protein
MEVASELISDDFEALRYLAESVVELANFEQLSVTDFATLGTVGALSNWSLSWPQAGLDRLSPVNFDRDQFKTPNPLSVAHSFQGSLCSFQG